MFKWCRIEKLQMILVYVDVETSKIGAWYFQPQKLSKKVKKIIPKILTFFNVKMIPSF